MRVYASEYKRCPDSYTIGYFCCNFNTQAKEYGTYL